MLSLPVHIYRKLTLQEAALSGSVFEICPFEQDFSSQPVLTMDGNFSRGQKSSLPLGKVQICLYSWNFLIHVEYFQTKALVVTVVSVKHTCSFLQFNPSLV